MTREHVVALFQDIPTELLDTPKVRERLKTESQVPQNWHTSTKTGLAILNTVSYFVEECNLQGKSLNEKAASVQARTITDMGIQLGEATTTFQILENQLEMLRKIGKLFTDIHKENPELVSLWFGPPQAACNSSARSSSPSNVPSRGISSTPTKPSVPPSSFWRKTPVNGRKPKKARAEARARDRIRARKVSRS